MSQPAALLGLINILSHPQNPHFAEAAKRLPAVLETFDPAALSADERTALTANLAVALENIRTAQSLTAQELGITQKRAHALQSYSRLK